MSRTMSMKRNAWAAALAFVAFLAAPAFAHHGWSWTQDEFFELTGVIEDIYIGNPHAALEISAEGEVWNVELAPLRATTNAGFVEGAAKIGDEVTAVGHRSRDESERRMKAVRIIVGGKTYDVYPDRVPTN